MYCILYISATEEQGGQGEHMPPNIFKIIKS